MIQIQNLLLNRPLKSLQIHKCITTTNICGIVHIEKLKYPSLTTELKSQLNCESLREKNEDESLGSAYKSMFETMAKPVDFKTFQGYLDSLPIIIKDLIETRPKFNDAFKGSEGLGARLRRLVQHFLIPYTQFGPVQILAVNEFYNNSKELQNQLEGSSLANHNQMFYRLGLCAQLERTTLCGFLLYAYFMLLDDIADGSQMRFGKKCWQHTLNFPLLPHKYTPAGSPAAINDVLLLQHTAHSLLHQYFDSHENFRALSGLFNYVLRTNNEMMTLEIDENAKFNNSGRLCSMETYLNLRRLQNGPILSFFPVASAAILHGVTKPEILEELKNVCLDLQLFVAISRDYVDCYNGIDFMGDDGTDVPNGRITWLLITAMECASPLQKKILKVTHAISDRPQMTSLENIGKPFEENVERVMEIYCELKLPQLLKNWQNQFYENIVQKIQSLSPELPRFYLRSNLDTFNTYILSDMMSVF